MYEYKRSKNKEAEARAVRNCFLSASALLPCRRVFSATGSRTSVAAQLRAAVGHERNHAGHDGEGQAGCTDAGGARVERSDGGDDEDHAHDAGDDGGDGDHADREADVADQHEDFADHVGAALARLRIEAKDAAAVHLPGEVERASGEDGGANAPVSHEEVDHVLPFWNLKSLSGESGQSEHGDGTEETSGMDTTR